MLKKRLGLIALLLVLAGYCHAQLSLFTWDTGTDERIAAVGPNGTSSGAWAACAPTGSGGSPQACQPGCSNSGSSFCGITPCSSGTPCACGNCRAAINISVPNTGGIFDLASMRASMDYRRTAGNTEIDGWFWSRGTGTPPAYFAFGLANNKLAYKYRIDDGAGGSISIPAAGYLECWGCPSLSGAAIPNDGLWHNYRFDYIQSVGAASIYIDGVWQYTEPSAYPGRALYWAGAPGAISIGSNMDGSGVNYPMIDNARIEDITLPVVLSAYDARQEGEKVAVRWQTSSETNNREYRIFRSLDSENYTQIGTIEVGGSSNKKNDYVFYDERPYAGTAYYSLVQIDLDGTQYGLGVRTVEFIPSEDGILELYPNPVEGNTSMVMKYTVASSNLVSIRIMDMSGRILQNIEIETPTGIQELELPTAELKKGVYLVQLSSNGRTWNEKFVKL